MFLCSNARHLWTKLGITNIIDQAIQVDRSGSAILEFILSLPDQQLEMHPILNFKQLIAVGGWYLWWIRRKVTHNESIPPPWRWALSVLSISSNHHRATMLVRYSTEAKFIPIAVDAITTEALAMRDGLIFANSFGCNRVEAESDSLQVINYRDGQTIWRDSVAAIYLQNVWTQVFPLGKSFISIVIDLVIKWLMC